MRLGVIQVQNSAGQYIPYNLNPYPVTYQGVTYQPAQCGSGLCDPRGIGLNPIVSKMWTTQMPLPNDPTFSSTSADRYNTQGYNSTISTPQSSNSYVGRIDHDFGDKWHLMTSYRYYDYQNLTSNQVDVGGVLPGATLGQPKAYAPRPQKPSYWVAGLTTTINPTMTNDFKFSYTRNYWQWADAAAPPQLPGLGGALEVGGESTNALIPYNVNTQSVRQRFWDGQDKMIRDDVTKIKGNHLFQFGGMYQRNFDYYQRNDNGAGIDSSVVYQIGNGAGINWTGPGAAYIPSTVPSNQYAAYENLYSEVLGIVSQPQVMYTRSGAALNLQPLGTPAFDQSVIPSYNVYFTDSWHFKPNFTLTYGMGWTLEMPPYELNGKQVELVDASGNPVNLNDYLANREKAALQGAVYNPTLGFATVGNVGSGLKYPYKPFYGEFSPRVAAAWNPSFGDGILGKLFGQNKTVIRGGYGRIFGRLNGVDLVLVPLLGTGLTQAVSCVGASKGGVCLGPGGVDASSAFRIGADGMAAPLPGVTSTLSQPYFPGVGTNAAAGDGEVLDPNFRPSRTDNFTLTIQREINSKNTLEVGYIGRIIRNEYSPTNLDAVPIMTTLNGQSFAQAYAQVYNYLKGNGNPANVAAQPFFEAALGGAGGSYCKGFANCTSAVATNLKSDFLNTQVYDLWAALNRASSWTLGRTMLSSPALGTNVNPQASSLIVNASNGYGNYNALFVTWRTHDFHGLTATSNFTWGRALGTGAVYQATSEYTVLNEWDLHSMYGPQSTDIKFLYNFYALYAPPVFRGQKGVAGHLLGGWQFAPIFTAQSGSPVSRITTKEVAPSARPSAKLLPVRARRLKTQSESHPTPAISRRITTRPAATAWRPTIRTESRHLRIPRQ